MLRKQVPNVPCGVERFCYRFKFFFIPNMFLMYRVELKEEVSLHFLPVPFPFLMYRVELKASSGVRRATRTNVQVPNVPCGVERKVVEAKRVAGVYVPNVPCGVESSSLMA